MQQVEQIAGFDFNVNTDVLTVARSGPAVDPPTVDVPPVPEQPVEYVVDAAGPPPGLPVDAPPAEFPGILVHAQAYTSSQQQVLSMWNSAEAGGALAYALHELSAKGYFDGGDDDRSARALALGGAVLLAVGALEAAVLSHPGLGLDGVDMLIGALLDREPIPPAELLDQARVVEQMAGHPDV